MYAVSPLTHYKPVSATIKKSASVCNNSSAPTKNAMQKQGEILE